MSGRIDVASGNGIALISAQKTARLWAAVILLMGLSVIATAWFPLLSITALPSENYNEGWNAYRQWMTVEGQPLYGSHPTLWTTNYPFLSFHIIGLLGAAKGNMVLAGRIVCFASLIATSVLVGGIVRGATGSRAGALYAGLCLFAWLASFNGAGRASNDPELLSVAIAIFGLFAYLKAPRRIFWLALSAIAFAISLFTKHDLLAISPECWRPSSNNAQLAHSHGISCYRHRRVGPSSRLVLSSRRSLFFCGIVAAARL